MNPQTNEYLTLTKKLKWHYFFSNISLIILFISSYFVFLYLLQKKDESSILISNANRQRMYAQKLTKNLLLLSPTSSVLALQNDLEMFQQYFNKITENLKVQFKQDTEWIQLNNRYVGLVNDVEVKVNDTISHQTDSKRIQNTLGQLDVFLYFIDEMISKIENEYRQENNQVKILEVIVILLSALVLILQFFLIFSPSLKAMNNQIHAIRNADLLLMQENKRAEIGLLAAGQNHELKNALAIAIAAEHVLHKKFSEQPEVMKYLEKLKNALQRVNSLSGFLTKLSFQGKDNPEQLNVKQLVSELVEMIQHKNANVKFYQDIPADLQLTARRNDIIQLMINLINNACDAMENQTHQPEIKIIGTSHHPQTKIEIIDNGKGIPKEIHAHVLKNFITTKQTGKGTGLGLVLCQNLARLNQGYLHFDEQYQKGCRFILTLPE